MRQTRSICPVNKNCYRCINEIMKKIVDLEKNEEKSVEKKIIFIQRKILKILLIKIL